MRPITQHNASHIAMFRKDYITVVGRLPQINPFLKNSFIKVAIGVTCDEQRRAFAVSVPEVGQQHYKNIADTRLIRCKKRVSDTVAKNNFVTLAKSRAKADPKKTPML